MGLQLVFLVETNKTTKTDWIYIKQTIEHFYMIDNHIKLTTVYMNGKGHYKEKEHEALEKVEKYNHSSSNNQSVIIYCIDTDHYDYNQKDLTFLNSVKNFCDTKKYEFVWFCKDIENVYLGHRIDSNYKSIESEKYKRNQSIQYLDMNRLKGKTYKIGTSNLCNVLDQYLDHKVIH